MKAKKALKRLHRVETILTTVIKKYAGRKRALRELLDSAKGTVVRATETLNKSPSATRKPPAKADQQEQATATATNAKRKSTGKPLRKTA